MNCHTYIRKLQETYLKGRIRKGGKKGGVRKVLGLVLPLLISICVSLVNIIINSQTLNVGNTEILEICFGGEFIEKMFNHTHNVYYIMCYFSKRGFS